MRTVLFVCDGNTFRSIMAEAIFNANAPAGWRAKSAGVDPGTATSPAAIELLGAIGIDPPAHAPRRVTRAMMGRADHIVTFGCGARCPIGFDAKTEDWPIPGGMDKTDAERVGIRDLIRARVEELRQRL